MDKNTATVIIAAIGASAITGAFIYDGRKKKKIEEAVDSLADHIHVDIEDPVVKKYLEKAVIQEFHRASGIAASKVLDEFKSDIRVAVSSEVKKQKEQLADQVENEIRRQVTSLDISKIKDEALEEAKDTAVEQLKDDMKHILEEYEEGLDNLATIYQAIANKKSRTLCDIPGLRFDVSI